MHPSQGTEIRSDISLGKGESTDRTRQLRQGRMEGPASPSHVLLCVALSSGKVSAAAPKLPCAQDFGGHITISAIVPMVLTLEIFTCHGADSVCGGEAKVPGHSRPWSSTQPMRELED